MGLLIVMYNIHKNLSLMFNDIIISNSSLSISITVNNICKRNLLIKKLYGFKLHRLLCIVNKTCFMNLIYNKHYISIIHISKLNIDNYKKNLKKYKYICVDRQSNLNFNIKIKKYLISINKYYVLDFNSYKDFYLYVNNICRDRINIVNVNRYSIISFRICSLLLYRKLIINNIIYIINYIVFILKLKSHNIISKIIINKFNYSFVIK